MEYVNLGKAGVKVSRIALGLGFRGLPTDTEAQRVVEHAIDSGINFLDCANTYGMNLYYGKDRIRDRGSAERVLGRAIKGKRDDVVITTKVFGSLGERPNDGGLSRYHIMREIDRSLTPGSAPTISTSTCSTALTTQPLRTRRSARSTT